MSNINDLMSIGDWKEWAISQGTREFVTYLLERKQNTLSDQNKASDWSDFKKYQGRIAEIDEILNFIKEQKGDE
jgi:hypothetical protein